MLKEIRGVEVVKIWESRGSEGKWGGEVGGVSGSK